MKITMVPVFFLMILLTCMSATAYYDVVYGGIGHELWKTENASYDKRLIYNDTISDNLTALYVCQSADEKYIQAGYSRLAVEQGSFIIVSQDYGATFNKYNYSKRLEAMACSKDGRYVYADFYYPYGPINVSSDFGVHFGHAKTFYNINDGSSSISVSDTGQYAVANAFTGGEGIYRTADYGITWTQIKSGEASDYYRYVYTQDGETIYASHGVIGKKISTNNGTSWYSPAITPTGDTITAVGRLVYWGNKLSTDALASLTGYGNRSAFSGLMHAGDMSQIVARNSTNFSSTSDYGFTFTHLFDYLNASAYDAEIHISNTTFINNYCINQSTLCFHGFYNDTSNMTQCLDSQNCDGQCLIWHDLGYCSGDAPEGFYLQHDVCMYPTLGPVWNPVICRDAFYNATGDQTFTCISSGPQNILCPVGGSCIDSQAYQATIGFSPAQGFNYTGQCSELPSNNTASQALTDLYNVCIMTGFLSQHPQQAPWYCYIAGGLVLGNDPADTFQQCNNYLNTNPNIAIGLGLLCHHLTITNGTPFCPFNETSWVTHCSDQQYLYQANGSLVNGTNLQGGESLCINECHDENQTTCNQAYTNIVSKCLYNSALKCFTIATKWGICPANSVCKNGQCITSVPGGTNSTENGGTATDCTKDLFPCGLSVNQMLLTSLIIIILSALVIFGTFAFLGKGERSVVMIGGVLSLLVVIGELIYFTAIGYLQPYVVILMGVIGGVVLFITVRNIILGSNNQGTG